MTKAIVKTRKRTGATSSTKTQVAKKQVSGGEDTSTRSRIVNSARSLFALYGYEGVALAEVARHAGVAQPLMHYHFESKEELWRASFDTAFSRLGESLAAARKELADLDSLAILKAIVRRFVYFSAENPEVGAIIMSEIRQPGPRLEWMVSRYLSDSHLLMKALLQNARMEGRIKPFAPVLVTNFFIGSCVFFFNSGPLIGSIYKADPLDPNTVDAYANFVVEALFHGIALDAPVSSPPLASLPNSEPAGSA